MDIPFAALGAGCLGAVEEAGGGAGVVAGVHRSVALFIVPIYATIPCMGLLALLLTIYRRKRTFRFGEKGKYLIGAVMDEVRGEATLRFCRGETLTLCGILNATCQCARF